GRVPRESHLADPRADPQPTLDTAMTTDRVSDHLTKTLMWGGRLAGVALGRAIGDRRPGRHPSLPQGVESRPGIPDGRVRSALPRARRAHQRNAQERPA